MSAAPLLVPLESPFPLPRAGAPALAAMAATGGAQAARRGPVRATGFESDVPVRVLLVAPDPGERSILEARLNAEGFYVQAVRGSAEALRHLSPAYALPQVIVCEAEIPGIDGFALCAQLRLDERTAHVPFILMGHKQDLNRELAGLASADQYVVKPIYANDVVALVKLWGANRGLDRELEAHTREIPLPLLVRSLLSGNRAGRVYLKAQRAQLCFREGRIIDASFENLRGHEAVTRMLLLGEGAYGVAFGPGLGRAQCSVVLEELCDRILPKLSRWAQLTPKSIPLDAVVSLDFQRLSQELSRLPDEVNRVLRLCDGRRTVRDCVLDASLGEVTTLEVINRLYALGVLVAAPRARDNVVPLTAPKRFFEPEPREAEERMQALFGSPESEQETGWAKQIEAFQIRTVVEPAERVRRVEESPELSAFVKGDETDAAALEDAFFEHTEPPVAPAPAPQGIAVGWWVLAGASVAVFLAALAYWALAPATRLVPAAPAPHQAAPPRAPSASDPVTARPHVPTLEEGMVLYESGAAEDAAAVLAQVVDAAPLNGEAWLLLGLARFDAHDAVGARDAATRAAELSPHSGKPHILLASIYLASGERRPADRELSEYLKLEPNGPEAQEAKALLLRQ